ATLLWRPSGEPGGCRRAADDAPAVCACPLRHARWPADGRLAADLGRVHAGSARLALDAAVWCHAGFGDGSQVYWLARPTPLSGLELGLSQSRWMARARRRRTDRAGIVRIAQSAALERADRRAAHVLRSESLARRPRRA